MASPPASTKTSLGQKLRERARQRWPQLAGIGVRFRGQFAYITGKLPDGSELPLCRLRYVGYASTWGFAIYRASHDDYQDNYLPSGQPSGTPEEALDCACGLYLGDPTAWLTPPGTDTPTDLQAGALVTRTRPWRDAGGATGVIALVSGAVDAAANVCYVLATRAGLFGLAVVVTSLYPGMTVLLARWLLGERMRWLLRAGLLLAAIGVVLLTA